MAQFKIVDPARATGESKELLTALHNSIKSVPNMAKALANSPVALSLDGFRPGTYQRQPEPEIEAGNRFGSRTRERMRILCFRHTVIGKFAGLTDQQVLNSRQVQGNSAQDTAALTFARELLEKRGQVPAGTI